MATAAIKTTAKEKLDFQLHVALIQRQETVTKSKAVFLAWLEGQKGLETRLAG